MSITREPKASRIEIRNSHYDKEYDQLSLDNHGSVKEYPPMDQINYLQLSLQINTIGQKISELLEIIIILD